MTPEQQDQERIYLHRKDAFYEGLTLGFIIGALITAVVFIFLS